ncbi:MAG: hypothetical protein Q7R81_03520 [Candidatus Peregrinibacteria bacterium]|nr:hypothetical protein [Candidatus Peregrinibacteria bacterium]
MSESQRKPDDVVTDEDIAVLLSALPEPDRDPVLTGVINEFLWTLPFKRDDTSTPNTDDVPRHGFRFTQEDVEILRRAIQPDADPEVD